MSMPPVGVGAGYSGIAAALRSQIARGVLGEGAQLPPISDLAQRYRTTPVTVRRALRQLEEEGLVRVEHGVGTFVAGWSRGHDLLHLPSFSEEMRGRNLTSDTVVIERSLQARCPAAAAALGEPEDAPLAMLARVRRAAEIPIVFQRSYMAARWGETVAGYTPEGSLYERLREVSGRVPATAAERMEAVVLPESVLGALEAVPGAPGWRSGRTTYDAAGEPLLFDEAYFVGARVALRVRRRAGQTLLEYELAPEMNRSEPCHS